MEHVPSGECCEKCRQDYWANRCVRCGTKLPCSFEKYLEDRNPQFEGSDERIYTTLHRKECL
jgi:hypothetical protein